MNRDSPLQRKMAHNSREKIKIIGWEVLAETILQFTKENLPKGDDH